MDYTGPATSRKQSRPQGLKNYFTEGMSWANRGACHLGHISPCACFDLFDKEQALICFNWRNLALIWGIDNLRKRARYTPNDEADWVELMLPLGLRANYFCCLKRADQPPVEQSPAPASAGGF